MNFSRPRTGPSAPSLFFQPKMKGRSTWAGTISGPIRREREGVPRRHNPAWHRTPETISRKFCGPRKGFHLFARRALRGPSPPHLQPGRCGDSCRAIPFPALILREVRYRPTRLIAQLKEK